MKRSYTREDRQRAAATYAVTGSVVKTAEIVGIPHRTLSDWKADSPEWEATVSRIRREKDAELDAHFTEIIARCSEEVRDRIEHGDWKRDARSGETYRQPLSAKDLALVGAICYDKRQLLRNLPTSRSSSASVHVEELRASLRIQAPEYRADGPALLQAVRDDETS